MGGTDVKIINLMMNNARISHSDIAKEIGISNVAIHQRIKKLEEKGVIKGAMLSVDYKQLGYLTESFVGIFFEKGRMYKSVLSELEKVPEVLQSYFTTGSYSLFIKIVAKNNTHLMEILNEKIQTIEGITRTETFISLDHGINRNLII